MDIPRLVAQLTLEEKCSLLSGHGFWETKPIPRLDIPSVTVSDGPHGLRKQAGDDTDHLGLNDSIPATCFPTSAGMAASFDRELLHRVGELLGEECQAEDVAVILGPGANIKRSPLCGRNFEYYSEDPYVSGELAAAHIRGVQSQGTGSSLKHFAVNNQETRRMSVNVEIDERALREIYLASFEYAVKGGKPWTVMCAYNKLGGTYCSENEFLLTQVLRGEWGFEGYTMTDWGACADHVRGVKAGMDLEMPSTGTINDRKLYDAAIAGEIDEAVIDRAVERLLRIHYRYLENRNADAVYDREVHNHQARRIARETIVLLKNDDNLLPLSNPKTAFIGQYAYSPRYQGTGSSRINSSHITSALHAVRAVAQVTYAQGFDDARDETDDLLLSEAIEAARDAEVAVLFVGLPDAYESEGFDRTHMRLPENQNTLIHEVAKVCDKVCVVLHNGSPVEMPWADDVQAILEAYLGGQAVGGAVVDLLYGAVSPCAKLAESFPRRLSDTPSYPFFPGDADSVRYNESLYVGYRYYDSKGMDVLFPFGHGLTYTTFEYANLTVSDTQMDPAGKLSVTVDITNTGDVAAKEIVQLYIHCAHEGISRPEQELRGFEKIALDPGETKTVRFTLDGRAFAYWETRIHDWYVEPGAYEIRVGASSRDIRQTAQVQVTANKPLPVRVGRDTTIGDILALPGGAQVLDPLMKQFSAALDTDSQDAATGAMVDAMLRYLPLHTIRSFAGDLFTDEVMDGIIDAMNR